MERPLTGEQHLIRPLSEHPLAMLQVHEISDWPDFRTRRQVKLETWEWITRHFQDPSSPSQPFASLSPDQAMASAPNIRRSFNIAPTHNPKCSPLLTVIHIHGKLIVVSARNNADECLSRLHLLVCGYVNSELYLRSIDVAI